MTPLVPSRKRKPLWPALFPAVPAALSLCLFLHSCLAQTPAQAPLPAVPAATPIDALGASLFQQSGATGMVLVLVHGHQVVLRGYGETAPGSHQPPARDSVFRLCSLTKIFTTDVLTRLVLDQTVRLDDPLQRFAPPGIVVPARDAPILLGELATHTAALPRELREAPAGTPHFTFPDRRTRWSWLPNQRLLSTPGTAALYSNIGFDLLSDALAAATHTQYAALLATRTLRPLHMDHTTFFPTPAQCSHLLLGAFDQGPCTSTEQTAGSSGLYSTASDMAIWLQYLLGSNTPAIAAQPSAAQATYLQPAQLLRQKGLDHAGEPTGIGLGWIDLLPPGDPSYLVEKTGGGAGFHTYIALNHATQTAVFLAATDGRVDTHLNLFNAANKLLLAVAGLPPLPEPAAQPLRRPAGAHTTPRSRTRVAALHARVAIRRRAHPHHPA
ncbi:D-alanyl-D-alanine-carboxypeptidase/endopeptidase AmpH [Acidipila sp. EB88]|uniref:D-alanyl-D-alanine- carboxypeptidase/endopeptidase AmpH n=1 Tax=Acidipila sp. EB88 TaxID=2305226 RepID=UPI0013158283|nr:D-alanyl-D-alanine-carboxypeptidase/endopeptidase AmpH [Acidipila sp. EB88]